MKIKEAQSAPDFTIKDVNGKTLNLEDYKGKKILLTFYRNVGCPICNLRFHEIEEQAEYFKSKNLIVLAVYESAIEKYEKVFRRGKSLCDDDSESGAKSVSII